MIETLSPPISKFAALGLLLTLVLAIAGYVVAPAARHQAHLDEQITAKRELLGRLTAFHADMPAAGAAARGNAQLMASEVHLPGETEPIRLANLQAAIRQMAGEAGVRLQSTRTLAPVQRDQLQLVGLQMSLQAPIEALQGLLHRLEVHRPLLVVDGLDVVPATAGGSNAGNGDRLLQVELRVLAYLSLAKKSGEP